MDYDVIIHQVVTHFAIVKIIQDYNNGITPVESMELGIIQLDIEKNIIQPFVVHISNGSKWNGFKKMVSLGMNHIKHGLDHLLFLFVLLLVSPLSVSQNRWTKFGGLKFTLKRMLKIITAFTIGHSLTLLILAFVTIPHISRPVEIIVAFTILFSALHALRPIFPNKEMIVTFIFGLVHGMAFASALFNLNLSRPLKLLSVFGFNIGIEIMQLGILILFTPVLLLSKFPSYKYIRIVGSIIAITVSLAWLVERITGKSNMITSLLNGFV